MAENKAQQTNGEQLAEFGIQRIYIKDISYEAPQTPEAFRLEWRPQVALDLQTTATMLEKDIHEIVLSVTATVKLNEQIAFLAEVKQAGIFTIRDFPADQMDHLLKSYCPSVLFPYAREVVSDLVVRGGFPPLYLAPVNFDALYQQHAAQQQAQQTQPPAGETKE